MLTSHNIDELVINSSGWKLEYVWNRYGNNTLLLLPDEDDEDEKRARVIVSMNESSFEESAIIDSFITSRPRTPFVIREENLLKSLEVLEDRLGMLILTKDSRTFSEFNMEAQKFYDFLNVCLLLNEGDDPFVYQVLNEGWEKFVPAKPKGPYETNNLLKDMYELAHYPEHLIDVIKALIIGFTHVLEGSEIASKTVRSELAKTIMSIKSMSQSFNRNDYVKKDSDDIVKKDIMDILAFFEITYISEAEIEDMLK